MKKSALLLVLLALAGCSPSDKPSEAPSPKAVEENGSQGESGTNADTPDIGHNPESAQSAPQSESTPTRVKRSEIAGYYFSPGEKDKYYAVQVSLDPKKYDGIKITFISAQGQPPHFTKFDCNVTTFICDYAGYIQVQFLTKNQFVLSVKYTPGAILVPASGVYQRKKPTTLDPAESAFPNEELAEAEYLPGGELLPKYAGYNDPPLPFVNYADAKRICAEYGPDVRVPTVRDFEYIATQGKSITDTAFPNASVANPEVQAEIQSKLPAQAILKPLKGFDKPDPETRTFTNFAVDFYVKGIRTGTGARTFWTSSRSGNGTHYVYAEDGGPSFRENDATSALAQEQVRCIKKFRRPVDGR
ncbi:MAG TPA: hypothetical protein PKC28_09920 [Bdellovibrionales bacterium]|nr:hypothetical protein [Bdellovibrionales bacterium]